METNKDKRGGNRKTTPDPTKVTSRFELVNKPKLRMNLTVSARGTGLCMYIPKETCELYGILASHILVVGIQEHYKEHQEV